MAMPFEFWNLPYTAQQLEAVIKNQVPIVGSNGNWWRWDIDTSDWVDTGVTVATSLADSSVTCPKLAPEARKSNRNLLDNAYWANPDAIVDQRGGYIIPKGTLIYRDSALTQLIGPATTPCPVVTQTSTYVEVAEPNNLNTHYYAPPGTAVRGYCAPGYTIDRWHIGSGGSVEIIADGLKVVFDGTQPWTNFKQLIEPSALENGRTYTISIMYKATGGGSAFALQRKDGYNLFYTILPQSDDWNVVSVTGVASDIEGPVLTINAGGTAAARDLIIKAVKLELGPYQTLAYESGGGGVQTN